nr:hypothetical protein [Tanacetum cinerariifolium]
MLSALRRSGNENKQAWYSIYTVKRVIPAKSISYYQAFNVKSLFGEIVSPKKSQVKLKLQTRLIIKITKHEWLKPLQIKTTFHKKLSINQECHDIISQRIENSSLGEKLETSTLREIVSLEKSKKNVNGLHPTS